MQRCKYKGKRSSRWVTNYGGDRLDLVVHHHAVVVLHEDGAPLGELGARVVTLALLLCPLQEHILAGHGGRH